MVNWSTYLLDELAGLRNDALPTCPECARRPDLPGEEQRHRDRCPGPDGKSGGTYGEIASWVVTKKANADASNKFVEYMMTDGYLDWLGMAPEGKFRCAPATPPTRQVHRRLDQPAMPASTLRRPLSEVYDADTINAFESIPERSTAGPFRRARANSSDR